MWGYWGEEAVLGAEAGSLAAAWGFLSPVPLVLSAPGYWDTSHVTVAPQVAAMCLFSLISL